MDNQNKPQDNVPKVEKHIDEYVMDIMDDSYSSDNVKNLIIEYSERFKYRIAALEKKNVVYKEALEKVKEKVFNHTIHGSFYDIAEQALNHKDNA